MPTDDAKLKKALSEFALALSKQFIRRQQQDIADAKEIASILSKISTRLGEIEGIEVRDLGKSFSHDDPSFRFGHFPPRAKKRS